MFKTSSQTMIGFLLMVLLASGIVYISLGQDVRIRVDEDKSTFYVWERGRWIISGVEYNKLFKGTTLQYRDAKNIKVENFIDDTNKTVTIIRTTPYKSGVKIVDTYFFDGKISSRERFPVFHTVEIYNGVGFIYQYEVDELEYSGETKRIDGLTSMVFGKNMKVEWDSRNYWATVYKSGILKIRYRPDSNHVKYSIRLFDPDYNCSSCADCGGYAQNSSAGSTINIIDDISIASAACIDFYENDNITIDCWGHTVNGDKTNNQFAFLMSGVENVVIKNCRVQQFDDGIYIAGGGNNTFQNMTITDNYGNGISYSSASPNNYFVSVNSSYNRENGFYISAAGSINTVITDSMFIGNNESGIRIDSPQGLYKNLIIKENDITYYSSCVWIGHNSNIFQNITCEGNRWGISFSNANSNVINNSNISYSDYSSLYFLSGTDNLIYNNIFIGDNITYFNDSAGSLKLNTTNTTGPNIVGGNYIGGNFWGNSTGNGFSQICPDTNQDGYCDSQYKLEENNIDYLPLSYPTINIVYPKNTTYSTTPIWLNWTKRRSLNWCAYNYDGGTNYTLSCTEFNNAGFWIEEPVVEPQRAVDGDWDTYADVSSSGILYINQTNPPEINKSHWDFVELKFRYNASHINAKAECLNDSGEYVSIKTWPTWPETGPGTDYVNISKCSKNEGNITLKFSGNILVYETAIVMSNNITFSIWNGNRNVTIYGNLSDGSMLSQTVYFFADLFNITVSLSVGISQYMLNISSGTLTQNYTHNTVYWYNATPKNQTSSLGIWNVTSETTYVNQNVTIYLNQSLNSCIDVYVTNTSSCLLHKGCGNTIKLTTSKQVFYNPLSPKASQMAYNWIEFINCTVPLQYHDVVRFEAGES